MYLPYDEEHKINAQDDSFLQKDRWDIENTPKDKFPLLLNYHPLTLYRYQVIKQADTVLAHFLLEDEQDFETIKNSYDYYEQITTHDSSLSCSIYGIMASKLGYKEKAYNYFTETATTGFGKYTRQYKRWSSYGKHGWYVACNCLWFCWFTCERKWSIIRSFASE